MSLALRWEGAPLVWVLNLVFNGEIRHAFGDNTLHPLAYAGQ